MRKKVGGMQKKEGRNGDKGQQVIAIEGEKGKIPEGGWNVVPAQTVNHENGAQKCRPVIHQVPQWRGR